MAAEDLLIVFGITQPLSSATYAASWPFRVTHRVNLLSAHPAVAHQSRVLAHRALCHCPVTHAISPREILKHPCKFLEGLCVLLINVDYESPALVSWNRFLGYLINLPVYLDVESSYLFWAHHISHASTRLPSAYLYLVCVLNSPITRISLFMQHSIISH